MMNVTTLAEPVQGEVVTTGPNGHALAESRQATAPVAADGLLTIIERIATNPNANLDALDRIVALRERVAASEAKAAFDRALSAMQPELPAIDSKGRITVYSKKDREKLGGPTPEDTPQQVTPYALLADINDAVRPALAAHGFAISHRMGQAADGKITVTGILSHRDGHREETTITLMHDSSGSKNSVQAVGSSISYGRRYTTLALLNISSRAPQDADDDGRAAGAQPATITADQAEEIRQMIVGTKSNEPKFLATFGVESVEALRPSQFDQARGLLMQKAAVLARKASEAAANAG